MAGIGLSIELIEPAYDAMIAYGTELNNQAKRNRGNFIFVIPARHAETSGKMGTALLIRIMMKP